MSTARIVPLVAVTACRRRDGDHDAHSVGDKYARAVALGSEAVPLLVPALGSDLDLDALLDRIDGVLVTGSPSNVDPALYGGPAAREGNLADPDRDATSLPLIRAALAHGVPLFAICRGMQELNVALGGSLHQHVQELPSRLDHRSDKTKPTAGRYALAHPIDLVPGGRLAALLSTPRIEVNSLHAQGIDRLADRLFVEAHAPDGTIEAVSVIHAGGYALGVQWHPEWQVLDNPWSLRLFRAFGDACRDRAAQRAGHGRLPRVA